jgi:hypothetical protein
MSSRTSLTVLDQAAYPENGPATKTIEAADTVNGNKFVNDGQTLLLVSNTSGSSRNLTFSADIRGTAGTKKVQAIANGEVTILGPFNAGEFNAHAADGAENGTHLWVTASGAISLRAIKIPAGYFGNAP